MADARDGAHARPLTTLRFVAALWVLLHHALPRGPVGSLSEAVGATGWLGVSLFFVLSGFLLTVRYAPDGTMRGTRRAFWLERVARLLPTYLVALLFAALLFARDARVDGLAPGRIIAVVATTVSGQQAWRPETACAWNCPAWSLSVEFWFYALFPVLIVAVGGWLLRTDRAQRGALVLAASLASAALVFPWLERVGGGWVLPIYSLSPLARWPEFLAGVGLAALVGHRRPAHSGPGLTMLGLGVAWIASVVAFRTPLLASGLHLLPVALPGFVLTVGGCWLLRGHRTLLDAAPLVLLGEASYALYLFHAPLHSYLLAALNRLVGRGYDTSWLLFGAYLLTAVGMAVLIHRRLELPWRARLRRRWGLGTRPS